MEAHDTAPGIAGVFVEFANESGHTVGRTLITPWSGQIVPAPGKLVACWATCNVTQRRRKLTGRVVERTFEVQHDEEGTPCVLARLTIQTARQERASLAVSRYFKARRFLHSA